MALISPEMVRDLPALYPEYSGNLMAATLHLVTPGTAVVPSANDIIPLTPYFDARAIGIIKLHLDSDANLCTAGSADLVVFQRHFDSQTDGETSISATVKGNILTTTNHSFDWLSGTSADDPEAGSDANGDFSLSNALLVAQRRGGIKTTAAGRKLAIGLKADAASFRLGVDKNIDILLSWVALK